LGSMGRRRCGESTCSSRKMRVKPRPRTSSTQDFLGDSSNRTDSTLCTRRKKRASWTGKREINPYFMELAPEVGGSSMTGRVLADCDGRELPADQNVQSSSPGTSMPPPLGGCTGG